VQAAGLIDLWTAGYLEPITPPPQPWHILAQQLMALALQEGGIGRHEWFSWVEAVPAFRDLSPGEVEALPIILRMERLVRVFRLTSRLEEGAPEGVVFELVKVVNNEAAHLRWLEEHEGALIEALGSALVA
jgi:ATP-dependent Lhr-like helicase